MSKTDQESNQDIAIKLEHVSFSYDESVQAINDVTLDIADASYICVLGANGSGKSTLARLLNALLIPAQGQISVFGKRTDDESSLFDIRSKVGMVFQNPEDQIVASIVENDVAFGPENLGMSPKEIARRVRGSLDAVGLRGFERRDTSALSGGQKQRVAVAGALAMRPKVLIFDEASSMIDPRGRAGLMKQMRSLNREGYTIINITHFIDEAIQADRIIVMSKGSVVKDGSPDAVLRDANMLHQLSLRAPFAVRMSEQLQQHGVDIDTYIDECELIASLDSKIDTSDLLLIDQTLDDHTQSAEDASKDKPILEFKNVYFTYDSSRRAIKQHFKESQEDKVAQKIKQSGWGDKADRFWVLNNISFSINEGDYIGVAGHTGAGKSTLIQLANALLKPTSGDVSVYGKPLNTRSAISFARSKVGVVFQYPERQLFANTVREDVAFGPSNLGLGEAEIDARVNTALTAVGLDPDRFGDKSPFELSGGQQRRCAVAGIIAMNPSLLILDEPTAGLDAASHDAVLQLIDDLREQYNLTVILISHNMNDLAAYCNRVIMLDKGTIIKDGMPVKVFEDSEALRKVGLGMPDVMRLAKVISIWPLPSIPTEGELAELIARLIAVSQSNIKGARNE